MDEILEIIETTPWTRLGIEVDDNGNIIKDVFKHKKEFLSYLNNNLSKYDVVFLNHEVVENEAGETTIVFRFEYATQTKILSNRYVKELANDIMLDLTSEEIQDIKKTENTIREKFLKVLTIDTEDVRPLYFVSDEVHTYLREDDEFYTVDQTSVLENAPTTDKDYISLVKVV